LFSSFPILALMVERNIDVLCPSGRANGEDDWERRAGRGGKFPKQIFRYVEEHDIYKCPADRELVTNSGMSMAFVHAIGSIAAHDAVIVRCANVAPIPNTAAR
jgi:hypothetical protein